MTDIALQQGGQVVRVTTKSLQGPPKDELFDVAIADLRSAERAVSESIRAIDERIEAVEPLPQSVIDGLGLKPGEIRKRP
jgi:hypothetical protein